ncbi:DUF2809 domain-containing protein [Polaromonas sp. P1(28)-13]|nr:DUF2809 domain-containing protein [Polaromonas sp. P1(28)-13]
MKRGFDREALCWALLNFGVEVLIATAWSHHRWLRGFFGDMLAVVWVYFLLKAFLEAKRHALALAAFSVGCLVELGQYVAAVNGWIRPTRYSEQCWARWRTGWTYWLTREAFSGTGL